MALIVALAAVLLAMAALDFVLPPYPSRWQRPFVEMWERRRPTGAGRPDPFAVLRLQTQLGVVSSQIRAIEEDPHVYARAHRLAAAQAAYDDLLGEACELASVEAPARSRRDDAMRWEEEQELLKRGWTW